MASLADTTRDAVHGRHDNGCVVAERPSTRPPITGSTVAVGVSYACIAVGFLFGLTPLLSVHVSQVISRSEYHYVPFVLICVSLMLLSRWSRARPGSGPRSTSSIWPEVTLLAGAAGMQVLAVVIRSTVVTACTALALVGILFLWLQRRRDVPGIGVLWALLWLCLPVPLGLDQDISRQLQAVSSRYSASLLDLLGVNHLMSGNALRLPEYELFVDEACGGVVSVLSVIACSAVFCAWSRCSLMHGIVVLSAGVFWAVVLNVLRITGIAFVLQRLGVDASSGALHDFVGLASLGCVLVLTVSTYRLLLLISLPIPLPAEIADEEEAWNPLLRWWNSPERARLASGCSVKPWAGRTEQIDGSLAHATAWFHRALICSSAVFACLGCWQTEAIAKVIWPRDLHADSRLDRQLTIAASVTEEVVPDELGGWRRVGVERKQRDEGSGFGANSTVFHYEGRQGLHAMFSFDYPFSSSWHELTMCYRGIGWKLTERRCVRDSSKGFASSYVEAAFRSGSAEHGLLCFAAIDARGEPLEPRADNLADRIARRFVRDRGAGQYSYQLQVWVQSERELEEPLKASIRDLFLACEAAVRSNLRGRQAAASED